MATWTPTLDTLTEPEDADALRDVTPLLDRLTKAFNGNATVARLISVDPAMITRWRKGRAEMSLAMRARVIELHDVFNRALQIMSAHQTMAWLFGSEPFFGGARPIDVLARRGAAPLIEALAGIEAGDYA